MMLFRLISWPYVRRHLVRTVLTLVAITIGIAVFVAMGSANAAVLASFEEIIQRARLDLVRGKRKDEFVAFVNHTASLSMTSAVKPALFKKNETAIVKQPACAAAMSSSGLVPLPSPKRALNE